MRFHARKRTWLVTAALAALGCTVEPVAVVDRAPRAATIELVPGFISLRAGARRRIFTVVRDAAGVQLLNAAVAWTSRDSAIAGTLADGTVDARAPGQTWVVAASGVAADSALVTVTPIPVPASLRLTRSAVTMKVGTTAQVSGVVLDSTGTNIPEYEVQFSSADDAVAQVTGFGVIFAQQRGVTWLRAEGGAIRDSIPISIVDHFYRIRFQRPTLRMLPGDTATVPAYVTTEDEVRADTFSISYASSDSSVLTVTPAGSLAAHARGIATLTATSSAGTDSMRVSVELPLPFALGAAAGAESRPWAAAAAGDTLYIAENFVGPGSSRVLYASLPDLKIVRQRSIPMAPTDIVVRPDGHDGWVAGSLGVMPLSTGSMIATGNAARLLAADAAVTRLYVGTRSGVVVVVDAVANVVIDSISVSANDIAGMARSPDGSRLYAISILGRMAEIDVATRTILRTMQLPGNTSPSDLAMSPDGTTLYVADARAPAPVIDIATWMIRSRLPNDESAFSVGVTPDGLFIAMTLLLGQRLLIIDRATETIVQDIPMQSPARIAFDSPFSAIYLPLFQKVVAYR